MKELYTVVILGKVAPEACRDNVIKELSELFNSSPNKMARLLEGKEVPLKATYTSQEAEQIRQQVLNTGALCEIRPAMQNTQNTHQRFVPTNEKETETDQVTDERISIASVQLPDTDSSSKTESTTDQAQHTDTDSSRLVAYMCDYIGKNVDYYKQRFSKFGDPYHAGFSPTWHWPGFLFFSFWALFRKQWLLTACNTVISFLLITSSIGLIWLLVWMLLRGVLTNYLYFYFVRKKALQAIQQNSESQLKNDGGTSIKAVWIGIVGFLVLSVYTLDYKWTVFLNQHSVELSQVVPGSDSQTRGNGDSVVLSSNNSKLAQASLTLSYIALSIKVLFIISRERLNELEFNQFIDNYTGQIRSRLPQDPWGKPYHLKKLYNIIQMRSAGPDRIYDNDDDIVQVIPI